MHLTYQSMSAIQSFPGTRQIASQGNDHRRYQCPNARNAGHNIRHSNLGFMAGQTGDEEAGGYPCHANDDDI